MDGLKANKSSQQAVGGLINIGGSVLIMNMNIFDFTNRNYQLGNYKLRNTNVSSILIVKSDYRINVTTRKVDYQTDDACQKGDTIMLSLHVLYVFIVVLWARKYTIWKHMFLYCDTDLSRSVFGIVLEFGDFMLLLLYLEFSTMVVFL